MNKQIYTLVEMLSERAQSAPDAPACTYLEDRGKESSVTYAEIDRRARAVAARLSGELARGDRALLLYPPGLEFIAGFFGCLYAGVIAVPVCPPRGGRSYQRLLGIVQSSGARAALTTEEGKGMAALAAGGVLGDLRWLSTSDVTDGEGGWHDPGLSSSSVAFLQYTSGSTSDPKGVVLTHSNLLHNLGLIHQAFGHGPESRGVNWLPPYHDMGLIGTILQPIYGGFPSVLMSPLAFVQRPLRWLQAITRHRATTCGGPNFAYALCVERTSEEQRRELDLSSWSVAFCGAEPISSEALRRFAEAFAPAGFRPEALYPCYGLAESTLFVTGGLKSDCPALCAVEPRALDRGEIVPSGGAPAPSRTLVSCGRPWESTQVLIVDPDTREPCPPDRVGEIWVAGASVASGYWGREEETRATFQATLGGSQEGAFLRTGDLGFLRDGELFITGRLKDLLLIDGRNIYPQDIERTVERTRARVGGSAAFSIDVEGAERLFVVHEVERLAVGEVEALASTMRRRVAEEHDVAVHGMVFIKPRGLPRTSSGKIARRACRAEYSSGQLPVVGEWRGGEWRWPGLDAQVS